MRRTILLVMAAAALTACGRSPPGHDTAYYRTNAEARRTRVAACSTDPGAAGGADCLAALKAAGEAESQRALHYEPPRSRLKNTGNL